MGVGRESAHRGAVKGLDPRVCDPPKPVVMAEEGSSLTAKIAKLSEDLSATAALSQDAPRAPPAPPALITSGALFEAKAYLPRVEPLREDEPITLEMNRVRIADEVNAATWITERIERPAAGALKAKAEEASGLYGESRGDGRVGGEIGCDVGAEGRARAGNRAAIGGVLAAAIAVMACAYVLVGRGAPAERPVLHMTAVQEIKAALFEWLDVVADAAAEQPRATDEGPAATASAASKEEPPGAAALVTPAATQRQATHSARLQPRAAFQERELNQKRGPQDELKRPAPQAPPTGVTPAIPAEMVQ